MTTRTITLTDRAPVRIIEDEWPVIAQASADDCRETDPALRDQALTRGECATWTVRVREHSDGRRIVYGRYTPSVRGRDSTRHGIIVEPVMSAGGSPIPGDPIGAIHTVADWIGYPRDGSGRSSLADRCIADLPAEDV